jgi:hypothetical protein
VHRPRPAAGAPALVRPVLLVLVLLGVLAMHGAGGAGSRAAGGLVAVSAPAAASHHPSSSVPHLGAALAVPVVGQAVDHGTDHGLGHGATAACVLALVGATALVVLRGPRARGVPAGSSLLDRAARALRAPPPVHLPPRRSRTALCLLRV